MQVQKETPLRATIRAFVHELGMLEANAHSDASCASAVRSLELRIRELILTTPVREKSCFEEARVCADMLVKLALLRQKLR